MSSLPVLNLAYCQKVCVRLNVTNSCGVPVTITNITWSSSDNNVATVSDSQNSIVLTAQGAGTATVTINYNVGPTPFSQQFQVNVSGVTTSVGTPTTITSPTFTGSLGVNVVSVSNIFSSLTVSSAIPVSQYYGGLPVVSSVIPPVASNAPVVNDSSPFGVFTAGNPVNITDDLVCNGTVG